MQATASRDLNEIFDPVEGVSIKSAGCDFYAHLKYGTLTKGIAEAGAPVG